jgi:3-oxoacyl-[acyl-carrier protein] reductase
MAKRDAEAHSITYEEARRRIARSIPAGRFGRPEEFGATCAYLCSEHAGFISGNTIHLDGAAYPGLI